MPPENQPPVQDPAPATPPVIPAAAPPAPPADTPPVEDNPDWLPGRLKQAKDSERKKLLQEIGVEDPKELQAKLARLQELENQTLTEQERTQKLIEDLTPKAAKAEQLQKTLASLVEAKFNGLTEQQQTAIDARANGDAEKRWELMQFMEAAGGAPIVAPPVVPKPATTTPPGAPPPPASPQTSQTPRQIWEAKKQTDPMGAALYFQMNAAAINNSPP